RQQRLARQVEIGRRRFRVRRSVTHPLRCLGRLGHPFHHAEADGRISASLGTASCASSSVLPSLPPHRLFVTLAPGAPPSRRPPSLGCGAPLPAVAAALTGPHPPGALAGHEPVGAGRTAPEAWTRHSPGILWHTGTCLEAKRTERIMRRHTTMATEPITLEL